MAEVTRLLGEIESGNQQSAEKLLPLVYEELRKLAAARLGNEKPGQTLQATALVHEAYVRLVGGEVPAKSWHLIRPRVEQAFANDKRMLISFLTQMSYALEKSGRLVEAIAIYEQCYAMGTENLVYDAMSAHDRMIALYLDTDQLERALAIVPAVLKTSRDQGVQTELKWLKRVSDKLLKHSQAEAVIPVLKEVLRREEDVQNDRAKVQSSTPSADWAIAVGKSREQC